MTTCGNVDLVPENFIDELAHVSTNLQKCEPSSERRASKDANNAGAFTDSCQSQSGSLPRWFAEIHALKATE